MNDKKKHVQRGLRMIWRAIAISGIVLANAITPASPTLADVSAPTVTVSPTTIYAIATYTVTFNTTRQLGTGGSITVVFPSDTSIQTGNITNNVSVTTSGGTNSTANINGLDASGDNTTRTVVIRLNSVNSNIGEDSQVTVVLGSQIIRNPSGLGNNFGKYSLNVSTSNETTPVASSSYTITLPSLGGPIPGVVTGKDWTGQILYQSITKDINGAINTPGVTTVEVGTGTYNVTVFPRANQTIKAVTFPGFEAVLAPAAPHLPAVSINVDNVTIDGFIVSPAMTAGDTGIAITGNNATVRNVTFNQVPYSLAVDTLDAAAVTTIENCVFNVTGNNSIGLVAISATSVTNCTFNVGAGAAGMASQGNLTLTGSRFLGVGNSGAGIYVTGGLSSVSNSTFSTMGEDVLAVSAGTLQASNCTITGSGSLNASDNSGVITAYGGTLILVNNVITNSSPANYVLQVSNGNVTACFNSITGNIFNVRQTEGTADITHNWWGTNASPEQSSFIGNVSYLPFLNAPVAEGRIALNAANMTAAASSLGVDIISANATSGSPLTAGIMAAAKYTSNPLSTIPRVNALAFYDVYISQPAGESVITIKLYNPGITVYSKIYCAGANGTWRQVSTQGINTTAGYAYAILTDASTPFIKDLAGTTFALVNDEIIIGAPNVNFPPPAPNLIYPSAGTTGVPVVTNITWSPITNAVYDVQFSSYPDFSTLIANASNFTSSTYSVGARLVASTTYYWRVRAIANNLTGPWATATFITGIVVIPPPISVIPPPPAPSLLSPANGATGVDVYADFTWAPVPGAAYDFQLSTNSDFTTLTANASGLTDNTYGAILAVRTTYYWRVRSTVNNQSGPWTKASFTTAASAPHFLATHLTINTTGQGLVPSGGTYNDGATVAITAIPESGWRFAGWTGDAVADPSAASTTILMSGDKAVTAHFVLIPPPIVNSTQITVQPPVSNNATAPNAQPNPQNTGLIWLFIGLGAVVVAIAAILVIKVGRK